MLFMVKHRLLLLMIIIMNSLHEQNHYESSSSMITQILFAFICLHGILISLFLLKALFFKFEFVSSILGYPNTVSQLSTSTTLPDEEETLATSNNRFVEQLFPIYHNQLGLNNEMIIKLDDDDQVYQIGELVGASYLGTVFKLMDYSPGAGCYVNKVMDPLGSSRSYKCIKLIDLKRLRKIIDQINNIPTPFDAIWKPDNEIRRAMMISLLVKHFRTFIETCQKLRNRHENEQPIGRQHVLHYFQVYGFFGKCVKSPNGFYMKQFKSIHKIEQENQNAMLMSSLSQQIMVIMPIAKMNLKMAIIIHEQQQQNGKGIAKVLASEWSKQIMDGLSYLHLHLRIAHLNLKPENILLFEWQQQQQKPYNNTDININSGYLLKLSDVGCGNLLPTIGHVRSSGHQSTTIFELSPTFLDINENDGDQVKYDLYCYAMVMLLMLVGYEDFQRTFIVNEVPNRLVCNVRYRLLELIELYDRQVIPESFVQWFRKWLTIIMDKHSKVDMNLVFSPGHPSPLPTPSTLTKSK